MDKKQTILVTGGAGYIGSIATKELIENGYNVVVLDSLENGYREAINPAATLEIANLADKESIRTIFRKYKFDAVIDFAAYIAVGESMIEPEMYIKNNVANFINLIDVMVESGCRFIIKSSTAAVYGNPLNKSDFPLVEDYVWSFQPTSSSLLKGMWNNAEIEGEAFFEKVIQYYDKIIQNRDDLKLTNDELTALRIPTSVYGVTKLLDEILMKKYDQLFQIKGIIFRFFNVAGADPSGEIGEAHPVETHLIPRLIKNITNNDEFQVTGTDYNTKDGTPIRDYIHVNDLASGHIEALEYLFKIKQSDIFNLGTSDGYSVFDILNAVEKITGKKVNYSTAPRRLGDPDVLLASSQKAQKVLGWKTKYDLCDMVKTAYEWHSKYPEGYKSK